MAQAKEQGLIHLPRDQIEAFLKAYDEQVAEGLAAKPPQVAEDGSRRRVKQHPATNLLLRLRDFRDAIWRFVTDWRVPFTNNLAERMVRPIKVKLKVIGGFRAMGAPVPSTSSAPCGKPANYAGRIPSKSCGWLRQPQQLPAFLDMLFATK
ncbi:transposase [Ectothiorhodospira haloalkaliphila]|uniref:IS66 family transposase n=1 Tax=Ectothiorhodospira haloalkaliphila TaxID=421628 RepID=UPI001EE8B3AB|nr:transposase [Ectothiorhodospira haloalkaliphila]